ncbi:MAG: 2Fe-2S iron-sulfur cluster binding domain-containing protein, partial [Magnetococcales bacterium]|nr:2Fe-2S iron-sulfur cluster binding domain-containing protein [Magnetococcales bacterium]
MTAQEIYIFRIQRNERHESGRVKSRWQEYRVEAEPTTTVLTALNDIRDHQDGTLTFRQSCRSAICGSCAMRISGRTRLACKTHVSAVAKPQQDPSKPKLVEVSPQLNQPVLKDLVVDINPFFKRVHQIVPYLQGGDEAQQKTDKGSYDQVNHVTQCIMCGSCYSDCTMAEVNDRYLGPASLAKAFRFVSDPREGKKSARLEDLTEPDGMWSC